MVAALKIHAQRDAAAKVQGILSVQYCVRATVLVARVNLSWMKRKALELVSLCHYAVDHPLWDKCGRKRAFELLKVSLEMERWTFVNKIQS